MTAQEIEPCTSVISNMASHVRPVVRPVVRPTHKVDWALRGEGIERIAYMLMSERPMSGWDARRKAADLWDSSPVLR